MFISNICQLFDDLIVEEIPLQQNTSFISWGFQPSSSVVVYEVQIETSLSKGECVYQVNKLWRYKNSSSS